MEQPNKPTNLIEVLRQIKKRPAMFLGRKKNIITMSYFIDGYTYAILIHNLQNKDPLAHNFNDFHDFTAKWLHRTMNGIGWPQMITEFCNGDEEKALDIFFDIFEEYANTKSNI